MKRAGKESSYRQLSVSLSSSSTFTELGLCPDKCCVFQRSLMESGRSLYSSFAFSVLQFYV
ncbi:MAG: hypothetical protein IGR76_07220 [Synechococcales cyanobacterium T60_A2020_003]|nr:hypothetical protein [Synechococcales cyanobacterium T60_A2020_003]